jgi:hypothetical protein
LLRAPRHAVRAADFEQTLAQRDRPALGGQEPVEAGRLALATLVQADSRVSDRDAVGLTVLTQRWPRGLDGLGAA